AIIAANWGKGVLMKPLGVIGAALIVTGLLVLAGNAQAMSPCVHGCRVQAKMCQVTGRVALRACRLDCRLNADPFLLGDCMHGCRDDFGGQMAGCRADRLGCVASCAPAPDVDATCLNDCGTQLIGCVGPALGTAYACVLTCARVSDRPTRLTCLQG